MNITIKFPVLCVMALRTGPRDDARCASAESCSVKDRGCWSLKWSLGVECMRHSETEVCAAGFALQSLQHLATAFPSQNSGTVSAPFLPNAPCVSREHDIVDSRVRVPKQNPIEEQPARSKYSAQLLMLQPKEEEEEQYRQHDDTVEMERLGHRVSTLR